MNVLNLDKLINFLNIAADEAKKAERATTPKEHNRRLRTCDNLLRNVRSEIDSCMAIEEEGK